MRLGGGIEKPYNNPEEWVALAKDMGYSAVLCPIDSRSNTQDRKLYLEAAHKNDLLIGEVGVWKNCLSLNDADRKIAMDWAKNQLQLADEMSANCCVNIAGSRHEIWDSWDEGNYSDDYYALFVDSVREIIDAVKPTNTVYSIEPMPWMCPESPDEYLQLIKDVDRKAFGVHLDFVNMINTPRRYVKSADFIKECFQKLGPYIKSIHGKDVLMERAYTTLIHECMPGTGELDYTKILPLVEALGPDTPLFVEHLPDYDTYKKAANYIRQQAQKCGVVIK